LLKANEPTTFRNKKAVFYNAFESEVLKTMWNKGLVLVLKGRRK
jgi:hypothetical protein